MDDHADIRARLVSYLTQAGLSTPRAHANLDAFLASAPTGGNLQNFPEVKCTDASGTVYPEHDFPEPLRGYECRRCGAEVQC